MSRRIRPPHARTGTHLRVLAVMESEPKPLTADKIAQQLGMRLDGVQSCLIAMARRGEVVRLDGKPGKPFRYRRGELHATPGH